MAWAQFQENDPGLKRDLGLFPRYIAAGDIAELAGRWHGGSSRESTPDGNRGSEIFAILVAGLA